MGRLWPAPFAFCGDLPWGRTLTRPRLPPVSQSDWEGSKQIRSAHSLSEVSGMRDPATLISGHKGLGFTGLL